MENGPAKKTVRINIFNQTYTVLASGDPAETEALAQMVDDLMTSIAGRAGNVDRARISVLACLHLADRLRTVEAQLKALKAEISTTSRRCSSLLDQVLESSSSE
ncbi:MAG: cell division protein ZapA [Bryobacteraceae bacterium]|nr:cell division protein ZapA [Bryobacteraceae bacterium]